MRNACQTISGQKSRKQPSNGISTRQKERRRMTTASIERGYAHAPHSTRTAQGTQQCAWNSKEMKYQNGREKLFLLRMNWMPDRSIPSCYLAYFTPSALLTSSSLECFFSHRLLALARLRFDQKSFKNCLYVLQSNLRLIPPNQQRDCRFSRVLPARAAPVRRARGADPTDDVATDAA